MANQQTQQSRHLCEITYDHVGQDLSPTQDAFGCAETLFTLLHLAFADTYATLSTSSAYMHFMNSPSYAQVTSPLPGDIIISPTGYGNGSISNGHTGIVVDNDLIASNNSYNSKLEVNYNIKSWKQRYGTIGGFPVAFFRRIA